MATYNGAKYIEQQLLSLASQTVLPYELVVTDDGSTDKTLAIVETFGKGAPFPVRIHRNADRLNFADNFLRAASLCQGDWIAFCDQDDVWMETKLEWVTRSIEQDVVMVVHRVQVVDEVLRCIPGKSASCRVRRGRKAQCLPPMGFFPGMSITFKATLVELLMQRPRFFDINNERCEAAHDKWVSSVADAVGVVKYLDETLVSYRQHGANTCGASTGSYIDGWVETIAARGSDYRSAAMLAEQYSECFHTLATSPAGERWKESLEATALRYRATHNYLLARAALYSADRFPSRLRAFASMSIRWSYRFNPIRPPIFAFMKDVFTVLFRPVYEKTA
jgi:glycosyltransferase involved in cell wall biosynthesis